MTPTAPPPGCRVTSTTVSRKLGSPRSGLATSTTPLGAPCPAAVVAASSPSATARRSPVGRDMPQLVYARRGRRSLRWREEDQGRQILGDAVEAVPDAGADVQEGAGR